MNIAIYGYGNLGKGVESAILQNPDTTLFGIFTRRSPDSIKPLTNARVYSADEIFNYENEIDVLVICSGSATDLPKMTPMLAERFNVVDSFDTHSKIPEHFANVDAAAKKSGHTALISAGWDPGLFSINRIYASAILPCGKDYTFWGKGVSQGHSDAIRRIDGVLDARQYTVPNAEALAEVRSGNTPELTTRHKHFRECYVVAKEGTNLEKIEQEIKTMPGYFADYDTSVTFISAEEMKENHSAMPHGGFVIRSGKTGVSQNNSHIIEYSLKLDSNPEFTGSALVAFARAVYKMHARSQNGCKTVLDIAPIDLSPLDEFEARKTLL